jgi:hypothetical protein
MTIKSKLIVNVLLTALIIVSISLASFFSMRFLQEKLSYMTENSTPFQIRTIEYQRELQACISTLVKVNTARTIIEHSTLLAEAEKSLYRVEEQQQQLNTMSNAKSTVSDELGQLALELFGVSEDRIKSSVASSAANADVLRLMTELTARLDDLDTYINNLQSSYSRAYSNARENTGILTGRLRSIEELRNLVRELQLITLTVQNAQTASTVLIANGKLKSLAVRVASNEYYKSNSSVSAVTKGYTDKLAEFVKLQSVAMTKKDEESRIIASRFGSDLPYKLNDLFQTLDQDTMLARDEMNLASDKQQSIYIQSCIANDILLANSQLLAMGLRITADTNRLFTLDSYSELVKLDAEIRSQFSRLNDQERMLESFLFRLDAMEELKILHAAAASLAFIQSDIYSDKGIIATLKRKLNAIEQANRASDKLREILIRQTSKGKENVLAAQSEQEKAITSVNNMVWQSLTQIIVIGSVAIIIGIMFGFWIYRSVLPPLRLVLDAVSIQMKQGREKAEFAEAVAGGDLNRDVVVSEPIMLDPLQINNDEMGMVLNAVAGMSAAQVSLDRAFSEMTASLRFNRDEDARRDHLKSGLFELNNILRVDQNITELAARALAFLAGYLGAGVGVIYLYDDREEMLHVLSTYAISRSKRLDEGLRLGEGLAGQVAKEQKVICLKTIPPDYLPIFSALGEADPLNIAILPIMQNDLLVGVIELGTFRQFCDDDFEFLRLSLEGIAIAINAHRSHQQVKELLEQTQAQAEELRLQQEELQQTNEELSERARILAEQQNFNIY